MAATPAGAAVLDEACKDALALLDFLDSSPSKKRRPVTKELLKRCDGLVFAWSLRAGAVIGFSTGKAFMIRKLDGKWTAPCFVSLTHAQAGALLGIEKFSTLLVALTPRLAVQLEHSIIPTFGLDISVQSQDTWEGDPTVTSRGAWGPGNKDNFDSGCDLLSFTTSTGVLLSFGLQGGVTRVDEARNAECYGPAVSASDILSGRVVRPSQMLPLYERLTAVLERAE